MIYNEGIIVPETTQDEQARAKLTKNYKRRKLNLTKEEQHFIENEFSSTEWRLNNLYTIIDKDSKKQIMKLNDSQKRVLIEFQHNKKIILKSRQQGISTFYLAYYLDKCLTVPGYSAGIQSYGLDESTKLQSRVKLMLDDMPEEVFKLLGVTIVSNNSKGITFSNGSILKIGNFRGDTLQGLHVSELAKIVKKSPEKARELKTGAFQAVAAQNRITIESTAEGATGLFYEMWVQACLIKDSGKELTPLDFQCIFLSWLEDPDCQMEYYKEPLEYHIKYITELEKELGIRLTIPQTNWLIGKLDELGEDFEQEYPATPKRAFEQSIKGTYLGKQYAKLVAEKRILNTDPRKDLETYVAFDLGMNDEMVLTFVQLHFNKPIIVFEYHNSGLPISHYVDIMFNSGFNIVRVFLPHDANVRDLSSGLTRIETFRRLGVSNVQLLEKIPFADSINTLRIFINSCYILDSCTNTLLGIQNYRKKWDKQIAAFLPTDVHDIHSNYMAAVRYIAQGLGYFKINKNYSFKKNKTKTKGFAI